MTEYITGHSMDIYCNRWVKSIHIDAHGTLLKNAAENTEQNDAMC